MRRKKDLFLIIIFIVCCILTDNIIGFGLDHLPKKDNRDVNSYMWRDLYNLRENSIDIMFMGSSHARFAFDTQYFDNKLGVHTFNLSTPDQTPVVGYYALKQALRYQKPDVLVYEAYWNKMCTDNNTTAANFVYNYMKDEFIKIQLMYSLKDDKKFKDFFINSYVKSYKNRHALYNFLAYAINGELGLERNNILDVDDFGDFRYVKNGYLGTNQVVTQDILENSSFKLIKHYYFNEKQLEYIQKTIDLCKENDIKVLFVTAPMPVTTLNFVNNYREYSDKINNMALKNGIKYIDYNIMNIETNIFDSSCFKDSNHLNSNGALKFDSILLKELENY